MWNPESKIESRKIYLPYSLFLRLSWIERNFALRGQQNTMYVDVPASFLKKEKKEKPLCASLSSL